MLIAVLRGEDVQLIDSRVLPVLFLCDSEELERVSKMHARCVAQGHINQANWMAPDYPNTEAGVLKRTRDQKKLLEAASRHETFASYVGDEKGGTGDTGVVIVPRAKIIGPRS